MVKMKNGRFLTVAWAFLENLLFGGLVHGWGSLVFVLKSDKVFSSLCDGNAIQYNDTTNESNEVYGNIAGSSSNTSSIISCVAQDSMLTLAFTVALSFLSIGCAVIGLVYLHFRTRVTRLLSMFLFISGTVMVAFVTRENPWLLFPGLMLVGIGGLSLLVTNMQISFLFSTKSSLIVCLLCGAFDTSSGVQLIIKIAHDNGVSLRQSYMFLACLHGSVLISTFCFLPAGFIPRPGLTDVLETRKGESLSLAPQVPDSNTTFKDNTRSSTRSYSQPLSLWRCIVSPSYMLHVVWASILQLRFAYYLASLNPLLNDILHNNVEQVSFYTNVSMYLFMTGIVFSPIAGLVYDWQTRLFRNSRSHLRRVLMPSLVPLTCGTCLALLLTVLSLTSSIHVLYVSFITLAAFRSFFYSMTPALISALYPNKYFGILYGVVLTVAGAVMFLQYELLRWAQSRSFNQVNWFFVAVVLTSLAHPIYQWIRCRRAEARE